MHDPTPLLEAILDQPDEDLPRLVYADWLDDHGDGLDRALAEFIRVSCAVGRAAPGDPHEADLARRKADLLDAHGWAWLGSLAEDVYARSYRRGLAVVTMDLGRYLRRREEVGRCRAILEVVCGLIETGLPPRPGSRARGGPTRRVGIALDLS